MLRSFYFTINVMVKNEENKSPESVSDATEGTCLRLVWGSRGEALKGFQKDNALRFAFFTKK